MKSNQSSVTGGRTIVTGHSARGSDGHGFPVSSQARRVRSATISIRSVAVVVAERSPEGSPPSRYTRAGSLTFEDRDSVTPELNRFRRRSAAHPNMLLRSSRPSEHRGIQTSWALQRIPRSLITRNLAELAKLRGHLFQSAIVRVVPRNSAYQNAAGFCRQRCKPGIPRD